MYGVDIFIPSALATPIRTAASPSLQPKGTGVDFFSDPETISLRTFGIGLANQQAPEKSNPPWCANLTGCVGGVVGRIFSGRF